MKALQEKVEDRLFKQDQSLQIVHMLCKPKPYYDEQRKAAIGYKSPLCLARTKQVQPALYNCHEIIKTDHVSAIVHNSEDTLEIAEIPRKKMNEKIRTPLWTHHKINIRPLDYSKENFLTTFTPQTQLTLEQIFWSKDVLKMKTEALKEQAKAAKPIKALTVKCDEIERKNLLIANDTLIANCLSKEVFYIATNSELNVSRFSGCPHYDYLKHLKESVATLRDIVEKAKVERPLDRSVASACLYTKHSQELLEYVIDTCLKDFNKQDKKQATTPLNRKNKYVITENSSHTSQKPLTRLYRSSFGIWTQVVQIVLWYLDSGCSKHMTGVRSRLRNFVKKFIGTVRFGNDHFGAIMGYGDYVIGDSVISRVLVVPICTLSVEDMMKSSPICLLSKAFKTKSRLWHHRLNHLNFGTINDLARKDIVRGLPRLKFEKDHLCSACQLGKSKKHTHSPKIENTNLEVLNTLHMDLCGPMRVQTINGKKYILVICRHFSSKISSEDSTAERQAVATTCYTQNRSFIHIRHNKTPYELVHNKKPDLTFLRVFGALCYPTNNSEDLGKLQPTADIGIFVGYAPSKK
nr:hypothetical protein [Tanacetum cinerariifolium]